jgi:basic amino acid/polyamine antiporter, APA family
LGEGKEEELNNEEQSLTRVLGQGDVIALAFGAMIGFSWIVLAGSWVQDAGTMGAVVAILIGGVMVAFVGLTYSELVSAMPKAGGEHNYVWRAMGARAAFVASWALALGYVAVVGFEAVALPTALSYVLPQLETGFLWTVAGYDVYLVWALVGSVAAIGITYLNYIGIRPASVFQLLVVLLLAAVGLLLVLGSVTGGEASNFSPLFTTFGGLMAAVLTLPFAFVGFDVIPQSAEEINLPYRRIGALLIISVILAVIWYEIVVVSVGLGLSQQQLGNSELATADAMGNLFGSGLFANILILGGVFGILTSWNGFLVGGSRLVYAMAESGMLPAWLARIHPRYRTPGNAIILIGIISFVAPFFGEEMLIWLVDAGSMSIVVAYLMVAISFIILRRREPEMSRPFRVGSGMAVGTIAVLLSLFFLVQYLPGMPAGLVWPPEWVIVLLWWIAGLLFITRMDVPEYNPEL